MYPDVYHLLHVGDYMYKLMQRNLLPRLPPATPGWGEPLLPFYMKHDFTPNLLLFVSKVLFFRDAMSDFLSEWYFKESKSITGSNENKFNFYF